jgi:hypothetical protein
MAPTTSLEFNDISFNSAVCQLKYISVAYHAENFTYLSLRLYYINDNNQIDILNNTFYPGDDPELASNYNGYWNFFNFTYQFNNLISNTKYYVYIQTDYAGVKDTYEGNFTTLANLKIDVSGTFYALDKEYDGTVVADVSGQVIVNGKVEGDDVQIIITRAEFDSKDASDNRIVTAKEFGLTGSSASKYNLLFIQPAIADIKPRDVSGTFYVYDKEYDGTKTSTVLTTNLSSIILNDDVQLIINNAEFEDKNVGNEKVVTAINYELSGIDSINYHLTSVSNTIGNIYKKSATFYLSGGRDYDGTNNSFYSSTYMVNGIVEGDTIQGNSFLIQPNSKNAGIFSSSDPNQRITIINTNTYDNYDLIYEYQISILPLPIIISSLRAYDKFYDGNTDANISVTISSFIQGDDISISATGKFGDSKSGYGKYVGNVSFILSGSDANNYDQYSLYSEQNYNLFNSLTANILPKLLTPYFLNNYLEKIYDGSIYFSNPRVLGVNGILQGDNVEINVTSVRFDNKNVGIDKNITVDFELTGDDCSNYEVFETQLYTYGEITPYPITSYIIEPQNKNFDGSTNVAFQITILESIYDQVYILATGNFQTANPGTNIPIENIRLLLSGEGANNYTITEYPSLNLTANIISLTPVKRDVSGSFVVFDKEYDGTVVADVSGEVMVNGKVEGDDVQIIISRAEFSDPNVGTNKTVTAIEFGLTGSSASNYNLLSINPTIADITTRDVSGSFVVFDKEYDGIVVADVSGEVIVNGKIEGDDVQIIISRAEFNDPNVGTNKTVTAIEFGLTGSSASNYNLLSINPTIADITTRDISGSFVVFDKEYDGTVVADVSGEVIVNGKVEGDDVQIIISRAEFNDPNVGQDKVVTAIEFGLTGSSASNYNLLLPLRTTANITDPQNQNLILSISSDKNTYVYGDSITLLFELSGNNVVGVVEFFNGSTLLGQSSLNNNMAQIQITTVNYQISNASFYAKYNSIQSNTISPTIQRKPISQTFTVLSKEFNGNKRTKAIVQLQGILPNDVKQVSVSNPYGEFDDVFIGDDKPVGVYYSLSGNKSSNYQIPNLPLMSTASIYIGYVQLTIDYQDKIYDGTKQADVSGIAPMFVLGDDSLSPYTIDPSNISFLISSEFDNEDVGINKTIQVKNVSNQGPWANNLIVSRTISNQASIKPKDVSGELYFEKIYNGNIIANLKESSIPNVLEKDKPFVGLVIQNTNLNFAYTSPNVGSTEIYKYSGGQEIYNLTGSRAFNYSLTTVIKTGKILPYLLTVNIPIDNKIYDTTTQAHLLPNQTLTFDKKIIGDDVSIIYDSWNYLDASAGIGKIVRPINIGLTGAQSINYALPTLLETTSTIFPKDISGNFTSYNKYYDGNLLVNYDHNSLVLNGVFTQDLSDVLVKFVNPFFIDSNSGENKLVVVDLSSSVIFNGLKSSNYNLKSISSLATIYPLEIESQVSVKDKYFDKKVDAQLNTLSYQGVLAIDTSFVMVDVSNLRFNNPLVGFSKPVSFDFVVSGNKSINYIFKSSITPRGNILKNLTFTSPEESYSEDFLGNEWKKTFGVTGQFPFTYSIQGILPKGLTFANGDVSGTLLETGIFDFVVQASVPGIQPTNKLYSLRVKPLISIIDNKIFPLSTIDLPSGSKFLFKDPNLSTFYQNVGLYYSSNSTEPLILGDSIFNSGTQILIPNPKEYRFIFGQVSNPKSFFDNVDDLIVLKVLDKNGNVISNLNEPIPMLIYMDSQPKPTLTFYIASTPSKLSGTGIFKQKTGVKMEYEFTLTKGDGAHKLFLTENTKGEMSESLLAVFEHLEQVDRVVLYEYFMTNQIKAENNYSTILDEFKTFIQQKFPDRPNHLRINQL